jgi:carotenoid 1,2-hydratase
MGRLVAKGVAISLLQPGSLELPDPPARGAALADAEAAASAVGGYAWWYLEVHDTATGRYGLTLILFAGSVFSPDYAARRRAGEPCCGLDFPAVNVALYERTRGAHATTRRAWVMNEYPRSALLLSQTPPELRIAASRWQFADDGRMLIELSEDTTRFFGRPGPPLCGTIAVTAAPPRLLPLELGRSDGGHAHYWQPLAPRAAATVELTLGEQRIAYAGHCYCDRNYGYGRLEDTFSRWGWAHGFTALAGHGEGDGEGDDGAVIVYRTTDRRGHGRQLSVEYHDRPRPFEVVCTDTGPDASRGGPAAPAEGLWRLRVPAEFAAGPYTCRRLPDGMMEDTPFYARFAVELRRQAPAGAAVRGVGEFLDLQRFRRPQLQYLLRYKTRRADAVVWP